MELHISSDDMTYITQVYEYAEDNLDRVDGYASLYGVDRNGQLQHKVMVDRSDVGCQFPKRVTFGQMLDMMLHAGREKIYFQREDWRNTHQCVALNNFNPKNLYIDIYYEDDRLDKNSEPLGVNRNGIPFDKHPFIPSYEDMFIHSWVVYKHNKKDGVNDEEKESINNCTI